MIDGVLVLVYFIIGLVGLKNFYVVIFLSLEFIVRLDLISNW